jgi:hypothetical protein
MLVGTLLERGDMLFLQFTGGNGGVAYATRAVAQYFWKFAISIGVPIPHPVYPPQTLVELAVLTRN